MNNLVVATILYLLSSLVVAGEVELIAESYLASFQKMDMEGATKMLHCPELYSKKELNDDHESIEKTLSIFAEEFGLLKSYRISNNNLYVAAMTACGTTKYWNENTPVAQLIYETKHEDSSDGYIVFSFSNINGKYVLAFVHHGLRMLGDESTNKIKHVMKRVANKNT